MKLELVLPNHIRPRRSRSSSPPTKRTALLHAALRPRPSRPVQHAARPARDAGPAASGPIISRSRRSNLSQTIEPHLLPCIPLVCCAAETFPPNRRARETCLRIERCLRNAWTWTTATPLRQWLPCVLLASDWLDAALDRRMDAPRRAIAAYEPGQFYRRELPCLRKAAVLAAARRNSDGRHRRLCLAARPGMLQGWERTTTWLLSAKLRCVGVEARRISRAPAWRSRLRRVTRANGRCT